MPVHTTPGERVLPERGGHHPRGRKTAEDERDRPLRRGLLQLREQVQGPFLGMRFTASDFADLLAVETLPAACAELAEAHDFHYDVPEGPARDRIIRQVMEHIDSDKPSKVGEHRAGIWESCWSDNLQKFVEGGYDPEKLVPDFI